MENSCVKPLSTFLPLLPKGRIDNVLYRAQIALRAEIISQAELRSNLESLKGKNCAIVFPSHFFEFEWKDLCLSWIDELSIPFFVQLSPGAELRDYQTQIELIKQKHSAQFRGIELVMDRAPHESDWKTLNYFSELNIYQRFVFCPVIEFNAIDAISQLPSSLFKDLFLYFPKKQNPKDSFFSADEIFIFLKKIKERIPLYSPQVMNHLNLAETISELNENEWEKSIRQNLNAQVYLENFPLIGKSRFFRSILIRLTKNFITAPIVLGPYLLIWLFHDPRTLLLMPKKFLVYPALFLKKLNRFAWYLIYSIRHLYYMILMAGCLLWMACCYMRTFLFMLYYALCRFVRFTWMVVRILSSAFFHPAVYSKHYFPPLYWIFFFPILKIYWIAEYQFKKRILKISVEEI